MKLLKNTLSRAVVGIVIFTILCGGIYTLVITGIAGLLAPSKANGSIIEADGKKYGSELLAQEYTDDAHMWGRIMNVDTRTFTDEEGKPVMYSWASNLSPASEKYEKLIAERVEKIRSAHPFRQAEPVPADLVTCSGSGLDPEISLAAAKYQVERLAENNKIAEEEVQKIIDRCTNHKFLGFLGQETVNVLKVNLMLDGIIK